MPRFYLLVITLLIASLVLLRLVTLPDLAVLAPPASKLVGSVGIDRSEQGGGSTECPATSAARC